MENKLNLKPLRVKVLYPGVDYVMVLVDRGSSVNNLKKEIEETLRKLFPHTSYGPINSLRKDNGKVLLPEWYPVDPVLKDEEEVIVHYESLVSVSSPCFDNNTYFSKGGQKSDGANLDNSRPFLPYGSAGHMNEASGKSDPILPLSVGAINSDHAADFLSDLNGIRVDDLNTQVVQQPVDGVLEPNEASSVRKRKGEIITDTSHRTEADTALCEAVEVENKFPFKKLKSDVVDNSEISKAEAGSNGNLDAHFQLQNELSLSKVIPSLKKNDGTTEDYKELSLIKNYQETSQSDIKATPDTIETGTFSGCLVPISYECNALSVADDVKERRMSGKKKKHKKGDKGKKFVECLLLNDIATESQEHCPTKIHKKKKCKKKNDVSLENAMEKSNWNEIVVSSSVLIHKSSGVSGEDDQGVILKNLAVDDKGKNANKEKKKKYKRTKEKSKDKEKEVPNEHVCSSSSFTVSDLKESGIGSGSPFYDIEKVINKPFDKKDTSADSCTQKLKDGKEASGANESFVLSQPDSDFDLFVENSPKQKSAKRNNNSYTPSKGNGNEFKESIHGGQGDCKLTDIQNASNGSKSVADVPRRKSIEANPPIKPLFDYETDTDIMQIQSKISKVVDDVVEESDYSQSLIRGPLEPSIQDGNGKLPGNLEVGKGLKNGSAIGTKAGASQKCTSLKDIRNQEQEADRKSKGKSKKVDSGHRKRSLEINKKRESDLSIKSKNENTIKKKKNMSTMNKNNLKNLMSSEKIRLDFSSDTSSMSFSDCVSHDIQKNNEKMEKRKKLSAAKELKTSNTSEKSKQGAKKESKMLLDQDGTVEAELQGKRMEEKGEKISGVAKHLAVAAGKEIGPIESTDDYRVKTIPTAKSSEKNKKSRRKSRNMTRKSVAKVQDWLSQLAKDVPIEVESTKNRETGLDDDRTSNGLELENKMDASFAKVIEGEITNVQSHQGSEVAHDKEGALNTITDQTADKSQADNDSSGLEKIHASTDIRNVPEKTIMDPPKAVSNKNGDNLFGRKTTLRSSKNSKVIKDCMVDLKFNALVEDGDSVVPSKVNPPLQPKTSFFQKSLTGFLSREDQKRFQSKLQSKKSPTVK